MMVTQRFFLTLSMAQLRSIARVGVAPVMCLVLTACAPLPAPAQLSDQPLPEQRAFFTEPPAGLLEALPQICTAPTQRILRPAPGVIECRMLLPPDATAGAILRYGGTVSDLPESVIRLRLVPDGDGFILAAANYLEVPRASGGVLRVVFPDQRIEQRMERVMVRLGGTVL